MMYIEYAKPLSDVNLYWLPEIFQCPESHIKIITHELYERWKSPNDHLGTYRIYVSDADALFLIIKYGSVIANFENSDK